MLTALKLRFLLPISLLILAALLITLPGCGGSGSSSSDRTPPGPVTNLTATQYDGRITLKWQNPADPDFRGVVIRRNSTATNSQQIYTGAETAFTDADPALNNAQTYTYTLNAFDASGNQSAPATLATACAYLPFTLAVIPDSQYTSIDYPALYATMMQWIIDNRQSRNIAYMLHEGDHTHNNNDAQWTNAQSGVRLLDGLVPYALCPGNHDTPTALFNKYFPVARYTPNPTFGGTYAPGVIDNSYHLFRAGGADWLIIALEFSPPDAVIDWAASLAANNPARRVIILTHSYLNAFGSRSSNGNKIWDKVLRPNRNATFTFNGHYLDTQGARLVSTADPGNKVYQMFANYQDLPLGGTGYMRLVEIDPTNRRVTVKTYSPYLQQYKTDDQNQFTFENVDLSQLVK